MIFDKKTGPSLPFMYSCKNDTCYKNTQKTKINRNTSKNKEKMQNINKNLRSFKRIVFMCNTSEYYAIPPICCNKGHILVVLTALYLLLAAIVLASKFSQVFAILPLLHCTCLV